MTRGWWIAAGIVAAANAAALGGAAWNRQGQPEAVLELTERELDLPPAATENTALALRLRWTDPASEPGAAPPRPESSPPGQAPPPESSPAGQASSPAGQASSPVGQASSPVGQASSPVRTARLASWFDRAKLEEVGFNCSLPLEKASAERYRAAPPRRVYAVLEFDGEAWRAVERSLPAPEFRPALSKLVAVDAGLDPAALRARWPDRRRAVVVPATAMLLVENQPDGSLSLGGRIVNIYPSQLNVPRPLNQVLAPLQRRASDPAGARYRVKVAWGRRDPWIQAVTVGGST